MRTQEDYKDKLDRAILSTIRLCLYGSFSGVVMLLTGAFLSTYTWTYPNPTVATLSNIIMWAGGLMAVGEMLFLLLYLCLWPGIRDAIISGGR